MPTGGGAIAFPILAIGILALGSLDIATSLGVIRLHAVALRRAPSGSGLVSWHVVTIASGNISKVSGLTLAMLDLLNVVESSLIVWLILIALGEVLTLAALVIIGLGQRARVRRVDARIRVTPDSVREPTSHRWRERGRGDTQPTPTASER